MAKGFRPVDRDQQFLLPPNMADWLPPDHLVWFLIDTVAALDMSAFEARRRVGGAGRAGFDPRMLLTLLIYAYACGQRSSRQIERLCSTDVAFRVICALDTPDHTTIARFRAEHRVGVEGLFVQVLALCARAGLGRVGVVAIDGTKIAANASGSADRSAGWLREQVASMLAEAEQVDAAEDGLFGAARGDELPPRWRDRDGRAERIRRALAELEAEQARAKAEAGAQRTDWQARLSDANAQLERALSRARERFDTYHAARRAAAEGAGKPPDGRPPVPPERHVRVRQAQARLARLGARSAGAGGAAEPGRDKPKINVTDPQARWMPSRKGFVLGYNAQLAVSADQIIMAAVVTDRPGDAESFISMMRAARHATKIMNRARGGGRTTKNTKQPIGVVLADAGYLSRKNLTEPGPDRLIAVGKTRHLYRQARDNPATGDPPADADPIIAMAHRLRTDEGIAAYKHRATTVEPVNGHLKDRIGLRRFALRGKEKTQTELTLAAAVNNLLKLYRANPAPA